MDLSRFSRSDAPASALLVRLAVGGIFLLEGLQKFIYPEALGPGRFLRIGLPWPEATAALVGVFEVSCGVLVLAGLFTRLAALPLVAIILVALVTTKLPILLGYSFWGLELRELPQYGFLSMVHEARTDLAMLAGSLFLVISGAGPWSLDRWFGLGRGRRKITPRNY